LKKLIKYKGFELEYLEISNPKAMKIDDVTLAFHGFGKSAEDFLIFKPHLKTNEIIYSFNLLQHGNSKSPRERLWKKSLQPVELKLMMEHVLQVLRIKKFSILAYSMGGRISLKIVELIPERINSITLIAPDGLKNKYFYTLVTKTWIGKQTFKHIINKPKSVFFLSKWLTKLNLVNRSVDKIVTKSMGTLKQRKQVGDTWFMYSDIFFNQYVVQETIVKYQLPLLLIYGKYDKLMPPKQGIKFVSTILHAKILIVEKGHQLMVSEVVNNPVVIKHLSCKKN